MKKITSLVLTFFLLIMTTFQTVYAEENGKIVFSMEYNEKNVATVKTGTEITVKCYLKNNVDNGTFKVYSLTNEVDFDGDFFEYIGNTQGIDGISVFSSEYTGNLKTVKFGGNYDAGKTYENKQYIGSFVLKVKATSGESIIKSDANNATVSGRTSAYETDVSDLKIIVGEDASDVCTLTFETNGGSSIAPVQKTKGETVNLSSYGIPTRAGYNFVGWCSDSGLSTPVTSVTLNENTTVYAKWSQQQSGGSGGGGGGVTTYRLTFETNGGTEIKAISKTKNTTVDLTQYVTTKDGCSFDGWYSDKELTKKITDIKMTSNVTVYAKWNDEKAGVVGGGSKPAMLTDSHSAYIVGREDGSFCPNDKLTRAEAAEMIYRLLDEEERASAVTSENGFDDVNDKDWFNTSVSTLAKLEIIKGRTSNEFAPNDKITRAEFTTIMVGFSDEEYNGADLFSDISAHWAKKYINIAASLNWVQGENGIFRPDDGITRAEVVTILNKVLNRMPESREDLLDNMITPPDNTDEKAWYYIAVQEAVNGHSYETKSDGIHEKWTSLTELQPVK